MKISSISSKATGPIVIKFHVKPPGTEGTKIPSNSLGHMTNVDMVKTLKNLQLPNQSISGLETLYVVALDTLVDHDLF